ncbi:unnamed protein product [Dicrocoelium dendriticum]|nr:unnamed protein product [Dicrocoelium dendriticum]
MTRVREASYYLSHWATLSSDDANEKPAELFDTHPLTEMLLSSEAEASKSEYLTLIENNWRSEWHRNGVQVPVCPMGEIPRPVYRRISCQNLEHAMRTTQIQQAVHSVGVRGQTSLTISRKAPAYHLDNLDCAWISTVNEERECLDMVLITDWMLEVVMEALEHLTYVKMHEKLKELEAQTLEFDENAKCDVCQSYEGEDGNELVFCDGCFVCVHQACYGISKLPEGAWICRQCEVGVKSTTPCSLCPNTGGAMKMTEDNTKWCHISCALWVPEVGFGSVELMEPVIRVDEIPRARRNLVCSICRSRYGAPIQCSNKKCKVAFHVTCAFQSNLVMRQELTDKDVLLVGLCARHSRKEQQREQSKGTPTKHLVTRSYLTPVKSGNRSPSPASDFEQSGAFVNRNQRLLELESTFYTLISEKELEIWLANAGVSVTDGTNCDGTKDSSHSKRLSIPNDVCSAITVYWKLKRRANFNQPLVNPAPSQWRQTATKAAETTKEALAQAARLAADMRAFDAFRRIRFGLDRARLVADMVLQRERRKLALFRRMWRISEHQLRVFSCKRMPTMSEVDFAFYSTVHKGDSVYDNADLFSRYSALSRVKEYDVSTGSRSPVTERHKVATTAVCGSPPSGVSESATPAQRPITSSSDVYTIPYEQLIVPEDIKQRLRSAIALITNSATNTGWLPLRSRDKLKEINEGKADIGIFQRRPLSSFTTNKNAYQTRTPMDALELKLSESGMMMMGTPPKRFKRCHLTTSSTDDDLYSNHSVPILTKFATIKLTPSSLRLL